MDGSFAHDGTRPHVSTRSWRCGGSSLSRDGGRSWTNVVDKMPGVPKGTWVSEVVPSRYDEGTAYVTFDGHRTNDFETYIFVTHDFAVVARMCDRVAVMYAGRIVELAPVADLFDAPAHPYSAALLRSVPDVDADVERLPAIAGQPPDMFARPSGCAFAPRCPDAHDRCLAAEPPEMTVGPGRSVRCWKHVA